MKPLAEELSVSLLGSFQVELEGHPVAGFRTAKVRALLAYLAVESQRAWSRATLADLLWPDLPQKDAQSNLRNAISNLRKVIGDVSRSQPYLLLIQDTLQFDPQNAAWVDLKSFENLVSVTTPDDSEYQEQIDRLERGLALYHGDFLEGLAINSAPFEAWVGLKSEQVRQQALQALRRLVAACQASGDLPAAHAHARRWVELEPWDEAAHRALMTIYWQQDQRSAALQQYAACCEQLRRDLAIEPEQATTHLYDQIRLGRFEAATRSGEGVVVTPRSSIPPFLRGRRLPPSEPVLFVARQPEIERLESELERAKQGGGRVLFITGDPGSGKTALLAEFSRRAMIKDPNLVVAWGQCNAYTGEADPYYPFREILQTLGGDLEARVTGGALTPEHAIRLWRFLPRVVSTVIEEGSDLINRFLSGKNLLAAAQVAAGITPEVCSHLNGLVTRSAGQPVRARLAQATLFNQVTKVFSRLSQSNPLLLILDDMQWIDPDSVNLLFHLGRRLVGEHIMLLGAYRAEEVTLGRQGERHPLEGVINELQTSLGEIHLDLMHSAGVDFIHSLLDSEPNVLTPSFRTLLYRHTGGHPLFTIELLRGMQLNGGIIRNQQGKWVEATQLNWDELPARVEAAIAERLSHLPPAYRQLLNAASVEGELFTAEIIGRLEEIDERAVIQTLSQDIGARHRLVVAQSRKLIGNQTLSQYRFRHILYQKYLYQQLDAVEKARLHEKIGSALEAVYEPELSHYPQVTQQLARHFELAGLVEKSLGYYTAAGKYAIQLGANREAFTHFDRALTMILTLPPSEPRDRQELGLRLSLGPTLTALRGWAAPELEHNYRLAEELALKMADDARLIPALWLLAIYRLGRSEHASANKLVDRAVSLAHKINDPGLLCLVELNVSPLHQGMLIEAREILTRSSRWRDFELQRALAYQFGMSPWVVAQAYLGNCLWLLGFASQAEQASQAACDYAEKLQIPMTSCYALSRACWRQAFAGELESARSMAGKLLAITRQHELRNFELAALFFLHWINVQKGDYSLAEVEKIHHAMDEYLNLGTVLNRTAFLILYAQACASASQLEHGMEALNESIDLGERTGERWFEAEAYRTKGELIVQMAASSVLPVDTIAQAESCFQAALKVAKGQDARMLELRTATSLCCLMHRLGRGQDYVAMLTEIVNWFSEGQDSLDLRQAKTLLQALNHLEN